MIHVTGTSFYIEARGVAPETERPPRGGLSEIRSGAFKQAVAPLIVAASLLRTWRAMTEESFPEANSLTIRTYRFETVKLGVDDSSPN